MSKLLGKAEIFSTNDLPIERVEVPEWGGHVFVRTMRAEERDEYQQSLFRFDKHGNRQPSLGNASGRLASLAICDDRGQPIFGEDDAGELGRKSPLALERVLRVARRMNGLDEEALENARGN